MEASAKNHKKRKKVAPFPKEIINVLLLLIPIAALFWLNQEIGGTGPSLGQRAPEIKGPTQDGSTVRLSDFRKKVIFLDFWADW